REEHGEEHQQADRLRRVPLHEVANEHGSRAADDDERDVENERFHRASLHKQETPPSPHNTAVHAAPALFSGAHRTHRQATHQNWGGRRGGPRPPDAGGSGRSRAHVVVCYDPSRARRNSRGSTGSSHPPMITAPQRNRTIVIDLDDTIVDTFGLLIAPLE